VDRSTKEAWLVGPGDLKEADVEDVPSPGMSVRVRALPAAYSNEAQSTATEVKQTPNGDTVATINTAKLEILQFTHGVIEPKFSQAEAKIIAERYAPAWRKVIDKIDELSGLDKEAIEAANARFQAGGASENGADVGDAAPAGSDRPDQPVRTGAGAGDVGG
jgi:hypothetical protein